MSIFYDANIEGLFEQVEIHKELQLIAASSQNGSVEIYDENCVKVIVCNPDIVAPVSSLSWHPKKSILAVAYQTGAISIFSIGMDPYPLSGHTARLRGIQWSEDGNRFLAVDDDGVCSVWSCDNPRTPKQLHVFRKTCHFSMCCFIGVSDLTYTFMAISDAGNVFMGTDKGTFQQQEVEFSGSKVASMVKSTSSFYLLSEDLTVSRLIITPKEVFLDKQVKLNGATSGNNPKSMRLDLLQDEILIICFGESCLRLLDTKTDDTFDLAIPNTENTRFNCFSFHRSKRLLAVGTDSGHVYVWQLVRYATELDQFQWKLFPKLNVGGAIEHLAHGSGGALTLAKKRTGVKVIREKSVLHASSKTAICLQTFTSKISVTKVPSMDVETFTCDKLMRTISVFENRALVACDGAVYVFESSESRSETSFPSKSLMWALDDFNLFSAEEDGALHVRKSNGELLETFEFGNEAAPPVSLDLSGRYMSCLCADGTVLIVECCTKTPKVYKTPRKLMHAAIYLSGKCNIQGDIMCTLVKVSGKTIVLFFDLETGLPIDTERSTKLTGVVSVSWDRNDARLIAIETKDVMGANVKHQIHLAFVTVANGFCVYEKEDLSEFVDCFLDCNSPFLYVAQKSMTNLSLSVKPLVMRDFDEQAEDLVLDSARKQVIQTLDFAFNLTIGHISEALKIGKEIGSGVHWANLKKMCIKAKSLDAAILCFGLSGDVSAQRLIRELGNSAFGAADEKKILSFLALYLGMLKESRELGEPVGELESMSRFYQYIWENKSLPISKQNKWIVKNFHYELARYFEEKQDFSSAAREYGLSDTAKFNVPRMAHENSIDLETFQQDKLLLDSWNARKNESLGHLEASLEHYVAVNDIESCVRNLCALQRIDEAETLCEKHRHVPSCFNIAKYYEHQMLYSEAIKWYGRAKCFHHAVRLAKEQKLDIELLQLALTGPQSMIVDIAKYFESLGDVDKAANIYYKGKHLSKAVELCMSNPETCSHVFEMIAMDIDETSDPKTLETCAAFFIKSENFEKAVEILIRAKKVHQAIDICENNRIIITESMAERITNALPEEKKIESLLKLANTCSSQGSFSLACKKFTQAGDRVKAIQALLRTGDIEKIVFFANVSGAKQPEIFVIAANYLQTLAYSDNPDIVKAIVGFYTKAKAFESLAVFYESCAQIEIDDFSDYDKAFSAIQEAVKAVSRAAGENNVPGKPFSRIKKKLELISQFVEARRTLETSSQLTEDAKVAMSTLQNFVYTNSQIEAPSPIRAGDAFSLLLEFCLRINDGQKVSQLYAEMLRVVPQNKLQIYLSDSTLAALKAAGLYNKDKDVSS